MNAPDEAACIKRQTIQDVPTSDSRLNYASTLGIIGPGF